MRRTGIIGGETHIGEVIQLVGDRVEIIAVAVRQDQREHARQVFGGEVCADPEAVIHRDDIDLLAVANENDRRAEVIVAALDAGKDVIADKPLAITSDQQEQIEEALVRHPQRRLLNLLTLRGNPLYMALREKVQAGVIGAPAFTHVRMAVRLKRAQRPPWFLDVNRSGGLFLDLLIHGLDQVEWLTARTIIAMTARTGNLSYPDELNLRDHAAVFCELDDGGTALVEGQRMLPDSKGSDYRVTVAGTKGVADMRMELATLTITTPEAAEVAVTPLPEPVSVVRDWLERGQLVPQTASLRANQLAIVATLSANEQRRVIV